mgnify:CR=1 FL=1
MDGLLRQQSNQHINLACQDFQNNHKEVTSEQT